MDVHSPLAKSISYHGLIGRTLVTGRSDVLDPHGGKGGAHSALL